MIGIDSGNISGIILTLGLLFGFGIGFNAIIERMGQDAEGFVWLEVTIGVLVTLMGVGVLDALINWNAAFIALLAFAASGSPMIVGDVNRYVKARRRLKELQRYIHDDETASLAE
jgi:hypothetical protein